MYSSEELFQRSRGCYFGVFPESRSNWGNKHRYNNQVGAETFRKESTYIILFLT